MAWVRAASLSWVRALAATWSYRSGKPDRCTHWAIWPAEYRGLFRSQTIARVMYWVLA